MITRGAALLAAAVSAAACLAAAPAAAQIVQGTIVDAERGTAVGGAVVLLVDSTGAVLDSTGTAPDGRFRVDAPRPGSYLLNVSRDGYLTFSTDAVAAPGLPVDHRVEIPVVSTRAARVMSEVIEREEAFHLPWEELCGEPVRPWEAGVLVGVARDRNTMEPIPRTVVRVAADAAGAGPDSVTDPTNDSPGDSARAEPWLRTRVATETGAFWFCNVPAGSIRVVARADGFSPDRYTADIRAGTISWYDALLRPAR